MVIRMATVEDAGAIAAVQVASWRSTYRGIVPDSMLDGMNVEAGAERWVGNLTSGNSVTYVAEGEMGVCGFVSWGPAREAVGEFDGELWALYLIDEDHGRGVGRRMMEAAARELIAAGYRSMIVWVLQENPAVGFYKHLGAVAVTGKMIEISGVKLPELALGWKDLYKAASWSAETQWFVVFNARTEARTYRYVVIRLNGCLAERLMSGPRPGHQL